MTDTKDRLEGQNPAFNFTYAKNFKLSDTCTHTEIPNGLYKQIIQECERLREESESIFKLQGRINSLTSELEAVKKELKDATTQPVYRNVEVRNDRIKQLEQENAQLKYDVDHLGKCLSDRNAECAELEGDIQKKTQLIEAHVSHHNRHMESKAKMYDEIKELKQKLAEAEKKVKKVKSIVYENQNDNNVRLQELICEITGWDR